ncbi:MAG: TorF family putative porin [Methylophilus sp.]|nr:TorF family putative porin [Methylophilus sp.]
MRNSLLFAAVLSTLTLTNFAYADEAAAPAPAAEPAPPYTITYNVGLYSEYIFRGLTQTGEELALQGGMDFTHSSGFYLGAWASNISWLEDDAQYENSSLELDIYGGYASTFGETGIGYNVGLLQYIYPGDKLPTAVIDDAETTEIYASLSYKWAQVKFSYGLTDIFGVKDSDGSYYAELNANYPIGETGLTAVAHVGYQDFSGSANDALSYTDWKLGLTKSWSNGVNLGAYYTDTDGGAGDYVDASNTKLGDSAFVVFVQKTF